jgi:hypothetical protein
MQPQDIVVENETRNVSIRRWKGWMRLYRKRDGTSWSGRFATCVPGMGSVENRLRDGRKRGGVPLCALSTGRGAHLHVGGCRRGREGVGARGCARAPAPLARRAGWATRVRRAGWGRVLRRALPGRRRIRPGWDLKGRGACGRFPKLRSAAVRVPAEAGRLCKMQGPCSSNGNRGFENSFCRGNAAER